MRLPARLSGPRGRGELRGHGRVRSEPVLSLLREFRRRIRVHLPPRFPNVGPRQVQLHGRGRVRQQRSRLRARVRERPRGLRMRLSIRVHFERRQQDLFRRGRVSGGHSQVRAGLREFRWELHLLLPGGLPVLGQRRFLRLRGYKRMRRGSARLFPRVFERGGWIQVRLPVGLSVGERLEDLPGRERVPGGDSPMLARVRQRARIVRVHLSTRYDRVGGQKAVRPRRPVPLRQLFPHVREASGHLRMQLSRGFRPPGGRENLPRLGRVSGERARLLPRLRQHAGQLRVRLPRRSDASSGRAHVRGSVVPGGIATGR